MVIEHGEAKKSHYLMNNPSLSPLVVVEHIATCAYFLWQKAGCPSGRDLEFWELAQVQLQVERHKPWESQTLTASPQGPAVVSCQSESPRRKMPRKRLTPARPQADEK
jgi:hypothetical protein